MEWIRIIPGILVGLGACIPLVIKLINTVQKLIEEKRWSELMKIVINYMEVAEKKLADGQSRREFVIAMARQTAIECGYQFDEKVIGEMIDAICAASKIVNPPQTQEQEMPPDSEGVA